MTVMGCVSGLVDHKLLKSASKIGLQAPQNMPFLEVLICKGYFVFNSLFLFYCRNNAILSRLQGKKSHWNQQDFHLRKCAWICCTFLFFHHSVLWLTLKLIILSSSWEIFPPYPWDLSISVSFRPFEIPTFVSNKEFLFKSCCLLFYPILPFLINFSPALMNPSAISAIVICLLRRLLKNTSLSFQN